MAKELRRALENSTVWGKNIKELHGSQPALAALLEEYVAKNGFSFAHYENATPAGTWYEGLADKPFFQPSEDGQFAWDKRDKDKPAFLLYGAGVAPYLLKAIRALPNGAMSLLVIEPSISLLAYVLYTSNVYEAIPRGCRLLFMTETPRVSAEKSIPDAENNDRRLLQEALGGSFAPLGLYALTKSKLTEHSGEAEVWRDFFIRMNKKMREWMLLELQYLGNSSEDTLLGMRQMALMSPWIAYGNRIGSLGGHFGDRPFVCVAAGPSLDKNFKQLADVQDKCVIVAADAVLRKLLKNGIRPHIVTVLERGMPTYDLFFADIVEEYPDECRDILLVAQSVCIPRISGRWPGPVCVVGKNFVNMDMWLVRDILDGDVLNAGTSVAHVNYGVASGYGASAIAIIGQDLAYGEDGNSHADGVGVGTTVKLEGNPNLFLIPGALGGQVYTMDIWLGFLRLLEGFIKLSPNQAVYDCTEGGAYILGTKVTPLADFIAEYVRDLPPMENTPAQVIKARDSDRRSIAETVSVRIGEELKKLDVISDSLTKVEGYMERVAAPGLTPARRVNIARESGELLDWIHSVHDVLGFIAQSYTHVASIELSFVRSLETVEQIERWRALHRDIVNAHRKVLSVMRVWLNYVRTAMTHYAENEFRRDPLTPDEAKERASFLFEKMDGADEDAIPGILVEFDDLMTRCDPTRLGWDGDILRRLSGLLYREGRSEEARKYMEKAAASFEGKEMPSDYIKAFYKDYIEILITSDMCCHPDFRRAEIVLAGAVELGGMDDELHGLMNSIMDGQIRLYEDTQTLGSSKEKTAWFRVRTDAQKALYSGDLVGALELSWRGIRDYYTAVPGWAMSHLDWLAETLTACLNAADQDVAAVSDRILDEIAGSEKFLRTMALPFPRDFYDELTRRGVPPEMIRARDESPEGQDIPVENAVQVEDKV
ncbi:MAG: DUF115 domain-containing protein [Synergistaceae bacterium]|jgi:hypothetical protein|nr:DUF115 domain-containing protein [Synergistaceae bacterium]